MKKIFIYVLAGMTLLPMATGCNSLDLESESTITDPNYWKSDTHFSAFNVGLHAQLRERTYNLFIHLVVKRLKEWKDFLIIR